MAVQTAASEMGAGPAGTVSTNSSTLIQIQGVSPIVDWVPSRYNARSLAPDGTFLLYNSYTGAFSGFPQQLKQSVEGLLRREGTQARREGLVKYLAERGYLVPRGANEFERARLQYGIYQHRTDVQELILLASEECNFRCIYCYENFARGTMEKWVREAVVKLAALRMPRLRALKIAWFGGEPLLGFEAIEEIMPACQALANEQGVMFSSSITTNAYLLTPQVFARLLGWNVNVYQITVDGTPDTHDAKRMLNGGGPTFDRIYQNLKALRAFPDQFSVHLRINFDRENLPYLDEFMDMLAKDFGGDRRFELHFFPVGKWGGPNDGQLQVCGLSGSTEKRALEYRALDKGLIPGSRLPALTPHSGVNVCYAARPHNLVIGADGKIMKCTIALDTADHNIVGRLLPDGSPEIDIDKFARWVTPYFEDDSECRKCFYMPVCQGTSCPLIRIEANERPCPDEKLHVKNTLMFEWKLRQNSANRYDLSTEKLVESHPANHSQ